MKCLVNLNLINVFFFVSKTNLFEIGGDGKDVAGIKEKSQGVIKIYIC